MSFFSKLKTFGKGFTPNASRPVSLFSTVCMGLAIGGGMIAIGIAAIIAPPLIPLMIFGAGVLFATSGMMYLSVSIVHGVDELTKVAKSSHEKNHQTNKTKPNNKKEKTTNLLRKDKSENTQHKSLQRPKTTYSNVRNSHSFAGQGARNKKTSSRSNTLLTLTRNPIFTSFR